MLSRAGPSTSCTGSITYMQLQILSRILKEILLNANVIAQHRMNIYSFFFFFLSDAAAALHRLWYYEVVVGLF